jgi:hypothetical protein
LNLMQFLTGLDKPASRVRPIDTHHVRQWVNWNPGD